MWDEYIHIAAVEDLKYVSNICKVPGRRHAIVLRWHSLFSVEVLACRAKKATIIFFRLAVWLAKLLWKRWKGLNTTWLLVRSYCVLSHSNFSSCSIPTCSSLLNYPMKTWRCTLRKRAHGIILSFCDGRAILGGWEKAILGIPPQLTFKAETAYSITESNSSQPARRPTHFKRQRLFCHEERSANDRTI